MQPWNFMPLEKEDYLTLEHAAYLKGLLRPFKSKGALETWASQCIVLRDGLIDTARHRVLAQARAHPYNLFDVQLALQVTGAGTTFLRWRNPDRSSMGIRLWDRLMASPALPDGFVGELHAMEQQRIVFNMQVSLLHSLVRQALDSASKMAHAETVYLRRMQGG